jgi:hypothetical protein
MNKQIKTGNSTEGIEVIKITKEEYKSLDANLKFFGKEGLQLKPKEPMPQEKELTAMMPSKETLEFAKWYSGMEESKVISVYQRWQNEQPLPIEEEKTVTQIWEELNTHPSQKEEVNNHLYSGLTYIEKKMESQKEVTDSSLVREAEELYPFDNWAADANIGTRAAARYNDSQAHKREAHINSAQLHRNDGLNQLIEWLDVQVTMSSDVELFQTEILTKAKEIQSNNQ